MPWSRREVLHGLAASAAVRGRGCLGTGTSVTYRAAPDLPAAAWGTTALSMPGGEALVLVSGPAPGASEEYPQTPAEWMARVRVTTLRFDGAWHEVARFADVVRAASARADGLVWACGQHGCRVWDGTWQDAAPLGRESPGTAWLEDGSLLAVGGWRDGCSAEVSRWDPRADRWETLEPAPAAWSGPDVAVAGDRVYAGGFNAGSRRAFGRVAVMRHGSWHEVAIADADRDEPSEKGYRHLAVGALAASNAETVVVGIGIREVRRESWTLPAPTTLTPLRGDTWGAPTAVAGRTASVVPALVPVGGGRLVAAAPLSGSPELVTWEDGWSAAWPLPAKGHPPPRALAHLGGGRVLVTGFSQHRTAFLAEITPAA